MPTNLLVRRAVACQPGKSFLFPLLALAVLITMAMVSLMVLSLTISDWSGMEGPAGQPAPRRED